MSKIINAEIKCPKCQHQFEVSLYRTIWGERPENRELVMNNRINVKTCPSCQEEIRIVFPFLYTNAIKQFAVWWEPFHDPSIDTMRDGFASISGENGYLASALRIKDWEEFKNTIVKFEKGEIQNPFHENSKDLAQQRKDLLKALKKLNDNNDKNV